LKGDHHIFTTAVTGAFALTGLVGTAVSEEPLVMILGPILVLTMAGVLFLGGAFVSRLICESLVVFYRIAENTGRLVEQGASRRTEDEARETVSGGDRQAMAPRAV
jgi:hypothetical protein